MIDVIEIPIDEFESDIYDRYIRLFPEKEQRDWDKIRRAYDDGYEKFYKIIDEDKTVGFFILEKMNDYPYYLDYFAIYEEYQSKGYGSKSLRKLLDTVVKDKGLIGEIEIVKEEEPLTKKRLDFYTRLGFKKLDSLYSFFGCEFNPIIYPDNDFIDADEVDRIMLEYYKENLGVEEAKRQCNILK
jgi:GNAT superfamily N-acetyltransferase